MLLRILLVAVLVLLSAGCSAKTTIDVNAEPNGSGDIRVEVSLDREAAEVVGSPSETFRGSDLEEAGWSVSTSSRDDGGSSIELSHPFKSPTEANALMKQLTGDTGPFAAFTLTQRRSGLSTQSNFSGSVDLTQGISSFGDQTLVERTGSRLGFDPGEFLAEYRTTEADAFPIRMRVSVPGDASRVLPAADEEGYWNLEYGKVTALNVTASGLNWKAVTYFGFGFVLVVAALVVFLVWKVDTYIPRHVGRHG